MVEFLVVSLISWVASSGLVDFLSVSSHNSYEFSQFFSYPVWH